MASLSPLVERGNGSEVVSPTDEPALERALGFIGQPFGCGEGEEGTPARLVPAIPLENLGDPSFCADHQLRYAYVAGAMANGIGSAEIVEAMARAGMLAFFGAAGLSLPAVTRAI